LILVVDDELAIRSVTEATLTQHGYRTLVAADGAEAISLYARQTEPIDAVFTDVMMPLVDGVALCRALKKMDPLVRIIASTGAAEEGRRQELQALNIGHVLGKPFSSDTLLAALDETLSSPQASLGPRQETLPAHPGAAR
jgi:CheY-like chemotaxis protein